MNGSTSPCTDLTQESSGTAGYGVHWEPKHSTGKIDLLNLSHASPDNEMPIPLHQQLPHVGLFPQSTSSSYTSTDLSAAMVGSWSLIATGTSSAAPTSYQIDARLHQLTRGIGTLKTAPPILPVPSVNKTETVIHNEEEISSTAVTFQVKTDDVRMDDGYKWRKLGNKLIKNEASTKAYFECAEHLKGCSAAKWVQRCTNEKEYMNFTYAGRHNHPRPE